MVCIANHPIPHGIRSGIGAGGDVLTVCAVLGQAVLHGAAAGHAARGNQRLLLAGIGQIFLRCGRRDAACADAGLFYRHNNILAYLLVTVASGGKSEGVPACGQLLRRKIKLILCCRAANRCGIAVLHLVPLESHSACAGFLRYLDKKHPRTAISHAHLGGIVHALDGDLGHRNIGQLRTDRVADPGTAALERVAFRQEGCQRDISGDGQFCRRLTVQIQLERAADGDLACICQQLHRTSVGCGDGLACRPMVGNAAVRLCHLSGIAAVGASIPAGMVIRVAALHNSYGSILLHLRQLEQCAVFLPISISLCQQGLIICAILDFDAVKGSAGQGHWNTFERTQFQQIRAAAGHGQRSLRVDAADELAARYHGFVPGKNAKPHSTVSPVCAALQGDIVQRQLCACLLRFSDRHRMIGGAGMGALHLAVCYGYIGAEDAKKRLLTGFAQGESI